MSCFRCISRIYFMFCFYIFVYRLRYVNSIAISILCTQKSRKIYPALRM